MTGADLPPGSAEPEVQLSPSEGPILRDLLPDTSAVTAEGHLSVGGVDLLELAEEVGTPVFVYDEAHMRRRCREAVQGFSGGAAYATKAFLCKAMAELVIEEKMTLDVSTGGEMAVGSPVGQAASTSCVMATTSPQRSSRLLCVRECRGSSSTRSTRSTGCAPLVPRASQMGVRVRLLLRVTPGIEAHTHEFVRTGQEDTKFGFSLASGAAQDAVDVAQGAAGLRTRRRARAHRQPDLRGVRLRGGDRCSRSDRFGDTGSPSAASVAVSASPTSKGGGSFDHRVGASGAGGRPRRRDFPPMCASMAEPGRADRRWRGGDAVTGWAPSRICPVCAVMSPSTVACPTTPGRCCTAVVMRRSCRVHLWHPGHLPPGVGKHCESGDVLVDDARLPCDLVVGDVLATPVTGACTGSPCPPTTTGSCGPRSCSSAKGSYRVVVRRETVADLLACEA